MRISKVSAAALAASVMFGGAALAFADDAMPADPTVLEEPTTTTAVEETTTTSAGDTEPTTTTTAVESPTTTVAGDGATAHPDNHGKAVSEAAHATPPGPGHGKAVSEVARSKAGKDTAEKTAKAKRAKKVKSGTG
jgi:hypothetical protein